MAETSFTKVALEHGWLGNMSPFPVKYDGKMFKTTEHLFQCLRFIDHPNEFEDIRTQKSPMSAKMVAKKYRHLIVIDHDVDIVNMRLCLDLKVRQHPHLKKRLMNTGDSTIIEDCSSRARGSGLFWGAAKQPDGSWKGDNVLGELWMELREKIVKEYNDSD